MYINQSSITAQSWCLFDAQDCTFIKGFNFDKKRQIASLTKMFTLATALKIESKLKLNSQCLVRIMDNFDIGTSSNLEQGCWIKIEDLYYGLMLPSGNDSAMVIAQYFGYAWYTENKKTKTNWSKKNRIELQDNQNHQNLYSQYFISYMNQIIKNDLLLKDTKLDNPHGLANKFNYSTAYDLGKAVCLLLRNTKFAKIVSTKTYEATLFNATQTEFKNLLWTNTNRLLEEGFSGVKTGITNTAGGCLVSLKDIKVKKTKLKLVTIVLKSTNEQMRFQDTKQLVQNHIQYMNMMS